MGLNLYLGILIFIFGLIMGSFFNVCIYRIPREESVIKPRPQCISCGKHLRVIDLLLVLSFIFLKGRCRYCREKISLRNIVVELLTGLVYVSLFLRFSLSVDFISAIFLMSVLIVVFFIDLYNKIIPHGLTLIGMAGGLILTLFNFFNPSEVFENTKWWYHLVGILPGSGILFLVALIGIVIYKSDEGMGMGDVYIFAPIGLFLGWKLCMLNLVLSIFIAGFISVILLIFRRKNRKDTIPFGPFIVIGTFIVLMWGNAFLEWYLGIVKI